MYQPIRVGTRMLVTLVFSFAFACVAVAGKHNQMGNGPGAGQFAQPRGNAMGNPMARATPTPTPKPANTGKPTIAGEPTNTGKSTTTGKSKIADETKITGKSKITDEPKITGKHKETRAGKGKPTITSAPSDNTTNTTGKSGVPVTTSIPPATATSTSPPVTGTATATSSVGSQGPTGLAAPTSAPIVVHVQQLPTITDPNQPTTTSTPLTAQVTHIATPAPTASVMTLNQSQPALAVAVGSNANTNQPTQSTLPVSGSNSVTNQQAGTAPTTGIQGQIVTGQPTQTRTAAPLQVSGLDTNTSSGFNAVSVTNPNGTPAPTTPPVLVSQPTQQTGMIDSNGLLKDQPAATPIGSKQIVPGETFSEISTDYWNEVGQQAKQNWQPNATPTP